MCRGRAVRAEGGRQQHVGEEAKAGRVWHMTPCNAAWGFEYIGEAKGNAAGDCRWMRGPQHGAKPATKTAMRQPSAQEQTKMRRAQLKPEDAGCWAASVCERRRCEAV